MSHALTSVLFALLLLAPAAGAQPDPSVSFVGGRVELHGTSSAGTVTAQPMLNFYNNGAPQWQITTDVVWGENRDFAISRFWGPNVVSDNVYLRQYEEGVAIGLNMSPPMKGRVVIGNHSTYEQPSAWPTLWLANGQGQTGEAVRVSSGTAGGVTGRWWPDGTLKTRRVSARTLIDPSPRRGRQRCTRGEITWTKNYLYVCVGADRWKRVRLEDVP